MNRNPREKRTGYPTVGVAMRGGDTVLQSRAGLEFTASGQPKLLNAAGSEVLSVPNAQVTGQMTLVLPITGTASTGIKASVANPFGYAVLISMAVLRITTQSSGASTLDIGVAADGTTSNDGLIDGLSGAAAGLFTNAEDAGTNGEQSMVWGATQFVNVNVASGSGAGLVATLHLTVSRII